MVAIHPFEQWNIDRVMNEIGVSSYSDTASLRLLAAIFSVSTVGISPERYELDLIERGTDVWD